MADAYSRDGRRLTVLADERLTAFLELERVTGVTLRERMKADYLYKTSTAVHDSGRWLQRLSR